MKEKESFRQHYKYKFLYFSNFGRVKLARDGKEPIICKNIIPNNGYHLAVQFRDIDGRRKVLNIAAEMAKLFLDDSILDVRHIDYKDGNEKNLHLDNIVIKDYCVRRAKTRTPKEKPSKKIFVASNGVYGVRYWDNDYLVVFRANTYKECDTFNKWQRGKSLEEVEQYKKPQTSTPKPNIHLCEIKDHFRVHLTPYMNPLNLSSYGK